MLNIGNTINSAVLYLSNFLGSYLCTLDFVFSRISVCRDCLQVRLKGRILSAKPRCWVQDSKLAKCKNLSKTPKQHLNSPTLWLCLAGSRAVCRSASSEGAAYSALAGRHQTLAAIPDAPQLDPEGRLWCNALRKHIVNFRYFLDKVSWSTGLGGSNFRWT